MKTNYHSHTHRCGHAEAGEKRYIEAALKEGFKIFGFADHVPQPYTDFRSGMRIQPEETADYVDTICALKEEYRGEIVYVEIDLADLARNADVLWTLSNADSAGNASVCLS